MRALKDEGFDINVFDRNTPLTDIVDQALQKIIGLSVGRRGSPAL